MSVVRNQYLPILISNQSLHHNQYLEEKKARFEIFTGFQDCGLVIKLLPGVKVVGRLDARLDCLFPGHSFIT